MNCITTIDWPATGSMLQGIGTLTGALAVLVAAVIGSRTFDNWRRQKLSERHIEQAERILTATYKVRRDLSFVRSPAMMGHEFDAAEEQLKANGEWEKVWGGEQAQKSLATAQAYYNRINKTTDDRIALEECQPIARALFGEKLETAIEELNRQFHVVRIYVDANHRDREGADADFTRKIQSTIWAGWPSTEENEVDQVIAAQVKLIEDICVPVLRLESGDRSNGSRSIAGDLLRLAAAKARQIQHLGRNKGES